MPPFNTLTFYISGAPGSILPGHPLWEAPLAGRSTDFSPEAPAPDGAWTIGRYFEAAQAYVSRDDTLVLLADAIGRDGGPKAPHAWDLCLNLLKHGAFYHPIQAVFSWEEGETALVLNGAVTGQGLALAEREKRLFSALSKRVGADLTPMVFGAGRVKTDAGEAGFLMAEWLEGYYEFHQTQTRGQTEVVVWQPEKEDLFLTMEEAAPIYRNIAKMLTRAYDPETLAQVFHWHHAAGDFIVHPEDRDLGVKLITVRGYGPPRDADLPGGLPGLFFFFVNLCLRMQLDRLDGVGEPVFLGEEVLWATISGMLDGIAAMGGKEPALSPETALSFFSGFSREQILAVMIQMMEIWPPGPSELPLIQENAHVLAGQILQQLKSNRFSDFY